MPKPNAIQLEDLPDIPILFEDRNVIAIDKAPGWMLAPSDWDRTGRNLQRAIESSIRGGEFWARSRNLKFLRFIHRLDAETSGVVLFARSPGAVESFSRLFQARATSKSYLAVVLGEPKTKEWVCLAKIGENPARKGTMRVDPRFGKESETRFRVLTSKAGRTLVEAQPVTGRTHQIRVHLAHAGHPVLGDALYGGGESGSEDFPLALRAVGLGFVNPFTGRKVTIAAPTGAFLKAFGFPAQDAQSAAAPAKLSN